MLTAVKDLLFYPDVFFMRIAREKVNLAPAIIIVGAGCLTGLAGTAICILFAGEYAGTTILLMTLAGCTLPFIGWGIFSGVLFCISRVFSGSGSLISTLQNAGYGMLPWALSTVADVFIMLFFWKSTVVYTSMWHTPQFAAFGVFLLSLVWSGYLWIYAVKHTHYISIYKAATAVILYVIVCFFMFTYGLPAI